MKQITDEQIYEALCQCDIPMQKGVVRATIPDIRALFLHLRAALTATQQAAPMDSCWTEVGKELPDFDRPVLVKLENNPHTWAMLRCFDGDGWMWASHRSGSLDFLANYEADDDYMVTHWKYLEAPEQREQPAETVLGTKPSIAQTINNAAASTVQPAARKPEPQAQAGELLQRWGRAPDGSKYLLERMPDGYWTPWHTACEAIAKKDAALKACVEALDQYSKGTVTLRNKVGAFRVCCGTPELTRDHSQDCEAIAAITQAQETME